MQSILIIDKVQPQQEIQNNVDLFEIEWFETKKHLFKRTTKAGAELHLQKEMNTEWQQADTLYCNGQLVAQISIKPTLVVRFVSTSAKEIADFCFYIGNRHLPLFVNKAAQVFYVPYDGNLYEQLIAKFKTNISLEKQQLFLTQLMKQQQNKQ